MVLFKKNKEGLLKCPRCNIDMKKLEKNNVVIDVCKKCKGMWLDDNEIEKLVMIGKGSKTLKSKK